MRQFSDDDNTSSPTGAFFIGLCAGAAIGAGLGLWFAPKSGVELRAQVTDSARDVGNKVSKKVNDLSNRGREAFDRAREVVSAAGDQIDAVTADAARTLERGRRGVQNVVQAAERS